MKMRVWAPLLGVVMLTLSSQSGHAPAAQAPVVSAQAVRISGEFWSKAKFSEPFSITLPSGTAIFVPSHCFARSKKYDLVVHFHGVPQAIERAINDAELNAVVVTINKGIRASAYGDAFHDERALDRALDTVDTKVNSACRKRGTKASLALDRIALSSWSAGFQAVYRLIRRERNVNRVDAVLLADSLHAALRSEHPRLLSEVQLGPFVEFADLASQGKKLMAITHSSIPTGGYASTTETAGFIVDSLGLDVVEQERPWLDTRMHLGSGLVEHGLVILGYEGQKARDHADHLQKLGHTLFPVLSEYWASN